MIQLLKFETAVAGLKNQTRLISKMAALFIYTPFHTCLIVMS